MIQLLPLLAPVVTQLVSLIPDPNAREKAAVEAQAKLLDVLAQQDTQQIEVNKVEAAHSSIFVAGWRPFVGWVCGVGLGWQFVGLPITAAIMSNVNPSVVLPSVGTDNLMELIFALLGLGGLRTFEKIKGTKK